MRVAHTPQRPAAGYRLLYSQGMSCPGCSGRNWLIGRVLAECGSCGFPVALPGADPLRDAPLETGRPC
jgi:hypothetical protein